MILRLLQLWRQKYISAEARDKQRFRSTCEAIRCKARLLFVIENGRRLLFKGMHTQEVGTQQQHEATGLVCHSLLKHNMRTPALLIGWCPA